MDDALIAAMGPLPRTHGLLGAMLETEAPFRTDDVHEHPRFHGWWPEGHPDMRSFLGVPIVAPEGVIGAFYLTEKEGPPPARFDPDDQELIELLAAHAAIAITNARLYERSRELTIVAERNRLALELHDVVSQKLFGLVLAAEAAMTLLDRDRAGDRSEARAQMERAQALGREAQDELRSLILELRRRRSLGTASRASCESTSTWSDGSTGSRSRSPSRGRPATTTVGTSRSSGSPRRPSRTPCVTRPPGGSTSASAPSPGAGSCSWSPTTASASTPTTRGSRPATSA